MTDRVSNSQLGRRTLLKTTGAGLAGLTGVGQVTGSQASSGGDLIWEFETTGIVSSSPTVVDGAVFIGNHNADVYALDADNGSEQWRFETGNMVRSSPTVVDGTVFVGGEDNHVYALDAGVEGSSEDSRVRLGTLGHHHEWATTHSRSGNTTIEGPEWGNTDDGMPGFGVPAAAAALGGGAYLLRLLEADDS